MPLRVVVADDAYLIRQAVSGLIEDDPGLELAGACGDLPSLLELVHAQSPDVVLTDVRMPPRFLDEGIQAAEALRASSPETGVLVLSQHVAPDLALRLLAAGSGGRGYLLKDRVADAEQLGTALRAVSRGDSVVDPQVVDALLRERTARASALDRLTPRELEVLACVARGLSNAGVGRALSLTERAVAKHINSIFSKLGLPEEQSTHRRVSAVLLFMSQR